MKQHIGERDRANSERLDKLQAKEASGDLKWVLKQTNASDLLSTIKLLSFIELHMEIDSYDQQGVCHIMINNELQLKFISVAKGLLIYEQDQCVVLSDCIAQKRKFHCNHNQLFLITLSSNLGKMILIFIHPMSQKEWFKIIKKSAKQIDFLKKYRILEAAFSNFYHIQSKRTKTKYTAQIYNKKNLKCIEQQEIINYYIKILRNGNITNYFPALAVFDDHEMIYIVTDTLSGNSFELLFLHQRMKMSETDLAFIIYSVLQCLRALQDEDLFHGNLNLENIILSNGQGQLTLYVINSYFRAYKNNVLDFYLHSIPSHMIAPELINGTGLPSIVTDVYQLGMTLALVSFFAIGQVYNKQYFSSLTTNIHDYISRQEQKFQKYQNPDYPYLFSACQLDLIKKMVDPDPNKRINVNDALKHTWFVNAKERIKIHKRGQQRHLPSLKTIIELVEQSEYEIRMKSFHEDGTPLEMRLEQACSIANRLDITYKQCPSPMRKVSESQSDILDEEHEISNLIGKLNNKKFNMMPLEMNNFHKFDQRICQTENNLQQIQD